MDAVVCLTSLEELRRYVHAVLCEHDQLDPDQAPLFQGIVTVRNRPCGLFFEVQGPRMVKSRAVWAGDEARILFYDSQGQRFAQARLSEGPDPRQLG
jgi:hypothetical protein